MTRILLIAPKCYPVNGAEAIVNIKLLRALSSDGNFEIDLVSRKDLRIVYPSDSIDAYNVTLKSINLIENKGGISFLVIFQSLIAFCLFKCIFPRCHWALRALPIVKSLINNNKYDFVLTKSSPGFILGAYLKKRGIKWVASWNDPFPNTFYPAPYGKGALHKPSILELLQIRQMRKADYHIFPTESLKRHMQSYLHLSDDICYIAPHVVFKSNNENVQIKPQYEKCELRFIHSGNLSSPRNPRPLVNALNRIIRKETNVKIHFTFLGKMEQYDMDYINSLTDLKENVSIIPMVEYKKSLEMVSSHDVACVIEADCGIGGGVFLPTKVTDFMQSSKPMLAVSPKGGVLEELYKEKAIGYFSDIHNEDSICDALLTIIDDYKKGALKNSFVPRSYLPESVVSVYKEIAKRIELDGNK